MKNSIKREQSQTGLNSAERENLRPTVRKYIFVLNAIELLKQLVNGKRVEGVLYLDAATGRLTFKAYNRKSKKRWRDKVIQYLEHGWVKESTERIKVYESIPKVMGTARIMGILDREIKTAKEALIVNEVMDND